MEKREIILDPVIQGASFFENYSFARELHKSRNPKAKRQFEETMKIRKEWNDSQLKTHSNV